jgi:WD40 repeat protein
MESHQYRYRAFISYRHTDLDRKWAKWIMSKLEAYRTPKELIKLGTAQRIGRLFRDDDEIPASSDLGNQLEDALRESEYLIVICSPNTPISQWVRQEIQFFQQLGRGDRIIPLLVEGEPEDSFPPELLQIQKTRTSADGALEEYTEQIEPLAADVRSRVDEKPKATQHRALVRIAAALLKCKFDALEQREKQRQKNRTKIQLMISIVICIIITVFSSVYIEQESLITLAKEKAQTEKNQALIQQSLLLKDLAIKKYKEKDYNTSMLLALSGMPGRYGGKRPIVEELKDVFLKAASKQSIALEFGKQSTRNVKFSPNQTLISSVDNDTELNLWSRVNGDLVFSFQHSNEIESAAISPNNKVVISLTTDGVMIVWDLVMGGRLQDVHQSLPKSIKVEDINNFNIGQCRSLQCLVFSKDGSYVLKNNFEGYSVWQLNKQNKLDFVREVAFNHRAKMDNASNNLLAIEGNGKRLNISSIESGKILNRIDFKEPINDAVFSPDGNKILVTGNSRNLQLFSTTTGKKLNSFADSSRRYISSGWKNARFSNDGMLIMAILDIKPLEVNNGNTLAVPGLGIIPTHEPAENYGKAVVWETDSGYIKNTLEHDSSISSVSFNDQGTKAISASEDSLVKLWDIKSDLLLHVYDHLNNEVIGIEFSKDGKYVLLAPRVAQPQILKIECTLCVKRLAFDNGKIDYLSFNKTRTKAIVSNMRILKILSLTNQKSLLEVPMDKKVVDAHFTNNDSKIDVFFSDGGISSYDITSGKGKERFKVNRHNRPGGMTSGSIFEMINGRMDISPDKTLLLLNEKPRNESVVALWSMVKASKINSYKSKNAIKDAFFSPDQRFIFISQYNHFEIFETQPGTKTKWYMSGEIQRDNFSLNGRYFFTMDKSSNSSKIKIWELETRKLVSEFYYSAEIKYGKYDSSNNLFYFIDEQGKFTLLNTTTGKTKSSILLDKAIRNFEINNIENILALYDLHGSPTFYHILSDGNLLKIYSKIDKVTFLSEKKQLVSFYDNFMVFGKLNSMQDSDMEIANERLIKNKNCLTLEQRQNYSLPKLTKQQSIQMGCLFSVE